MRRSTTDENVGIQITFAPVRTATSTAAGFRPPTSKSQQMPPNTRTRCAVFSIRIAIGPVGIGVALQHQRAQPERIGLPHRLRRVHAALPVRIRAVVAVHVDRPHHQRVRVEVHATPLASRRRRCQAPAAARSPGRTTRVENTSSARARAPRAAAA